MKSEVEFVNSCHSSDSYENICVYTEQGLQDGWVAFVLHHIFQCFITGSVTLEIGFYFWHQLFLWLIPFMNIHLLSQLWLSKRKKQKKKHRGSLKSFITDKHKRLEEYTYKQAHVFMYFSFLFCSSGLTFWEQLENCSTVGLNYIITIYCTWYCAILAVPLCKYYASKSFGIILTPHLNVGNQAQRQFWKVTRAKQLIDVNQ